MKRVVGLALGILTAIGGFLDIGDLANAVVGQRAGTPPGREGPRPLRESARTAHWLGQTISEPPRVSRLGEANPRPTHYERVQWSRHLRLLRDDAAG